ncbi:MAG: glycerophosphodiester phosphodiesterase family protein [Propionicimonas sp.]|nr:glycerophosphodiester phosphodiesterase family protein [Propionicimonas sp.]
MLRPPVSHRVHRSVAAAAAVLAGLSLIASGIGASPASAVTVGGDGKPITNARGVTFGIVSHRGGALERPENSIEAYQYSVDQGFDVIETDLLFTSDGRGVMNHNDTLQSRCTQAGQKIHLMTLAQVQQVRCEDFRTGEKTVPIPTFDEFAAVVKDSDVRIDLDIKTWSGQPASGERRYAERAIKLLKTYGLLERTSILTFRWSTTLPTIRKLAPKIRVVGLDNKPMDLGRVRLAASLGASGFGIKAKDSPTNLLKYIKAKGMDPVPWEVKGSQLLSYAIHFGGKVQGLSSDTPAATRQDLVDGKININPTPGTTVTTLSKSVTIAKKATYKAKKRKYPRVMGTAVPWGRLAMLDSVKVKITVTKGPGKGYLSIGAADSPLSSSLKVRLPKGTKSIWVKVPVGNAGKLRVFTSRKATVKLAVVEYTNLKFS